MIDKLFGKLGQNLRDFVDNARELPFGYAERSLVGQLAIAAHDCDCYTLQDYDVSIKEKLRKGLKNRYRPDLWLLESDGRDYVFEVKSQDYAPIDVTTTRLIELVNYRLRKALKQISEQGQVEGKYLCALIAIKIFCAPRKWINYGKNSLSYNREIKHLKEVSKSIPRNSFEAKPDFHSCYFIPYKTAKRLCWKNEKSQEEPPLLGILWFGSLKLYRKTFKV